MSLIFLSNKILCLENLIPYFTLSYFSGILSVINIDYKPLEVWTYLSEFNPPLIDFLLPHATWNKTPYGKLESVVVELPFWDPKKQIPIGKA